MTAIGGAYEVVRFRFCLVLNDLVGVISADGQTFSVERSVIRSKDSLLPISFCFLYAFDPVNVRPFGRANKGFTLIIIVPSSIFHFSLFTFHFFVVPLHRINKQSQKTRWDESWPLTMGSAVQASL